MAVDVAGEPKDAKNENAKVDTKKPKEKRDKSNLPPSKVVIRHLPPTMTKEQFIDDISPLPEYDYFNFVSADFSLGQYASCVAYINFLKQEDIFIFKEKFDDYVFLDKKGNEYTAVVEFSPFQKIPKKRNRKDVKCGTIEQDPDYESFLESLNNPVEVNLPSIETYLEEIETKEKELKANHGVPNVRTPLLEFVKQRKIEKQKLRDEKREERRRKEVEKRRLRDEERRKRKVERDRLKESTTKEKSNTKESKTDNSDNEGVVKVLKNPSNTAKKSDKTSDSVKEKEFKKKYEKPVLKDKEEDKCERLKSKSDPSKKGKDKSSRTSSIDKLKQKKSKSPERKALDNAGKREKVNPPKNPKNELKKDEKFKIEDLSNKDDEKYLEKPDEETQFKDLKRSEKRIRNKDRPSMEIYRPGARRLTKASSSVSPNKELSPDSSNSSSPTMQVAKTTKSSSKKAEG